MTLSAGDLVAIIRQEDENTSFFRSNLVDLHRYEQCETVSLITRLLPIVQSNTVVNCVNILAPGIRWSFGQKYNPNPTTPTPPFNKLIPSDVFRLLYLNGASLFGMSGEVSVSFRG